MANTESFLSGLSKSLSNGIDESSKIKMQLALQSQHIQMQQDAELGRQKQLASYTNSLKNDDVTPEQFISGVRTAFPKLAPEQEKNLQDFVGQFKDQKIPGSFANSFMSNMTKANISQNHFTRPIAEHYNEAGVTGTRYRDPVTGDVVFQSAPSLDPKLTGKLSNFERKHQKLTSIIDRVKNMVEGQITATNPAERMAQKVATGWGRFAQTTEGQSLMKAYKDQLTEISLLTDKEFTETARQAESILKATAQSFPDPMTDNLQTGMEKLQTYYDRINSNFQADFDATGIDPNEFHNYMQHQMGKVGQGLAPKQQPQSVQQPTHKPASQKAKDYLKTLGY